MTTKEEFIAEVQALHNHLVVEHNRVHRVIGANISDDYYYILESPDWREPGKRRYHSCISWIYTLKGKLDDADYQRLDDEFKLNGSIGTEEFILEIEE